MMCRLRIPAIRAERITDETFDAPHPNPDHMIGVEYDPVERVVRVGTEVGRIGDWLVEDQGGGLPDIYLDGAFRHRFEEVSA